jgi:integrase
MRLYALTELHDPQAIELFITEEDARRALEDCLRDEPEWRGVLEVKEIVRREHAPRPAHRSDQIQRKRHDLQLTQQLLGHADIRSTVRYAQFDTEDLAEALLDLYGEEED